MSPSGWQQRLPLQACRQTKGGNEAVEPVAVPRRLCVVVPPPNAGASCLAGWMGCLMLAALATNRRSKCLAVWFLGKGRFVVGPVRYVHYTVLMVSIPTSENRWPRDCQLRQLSCILDSCTISASYEVSQAQKALLLMPRTAKGASTSSDELNAQVSLPTNDEYHAFQDQDQLQEH